MDHPLSSEDMRSPMDIYKYANDFLDHIGKEEWCEGTIEVLNARKDRLGKSFIEMVKNCAIIRGWKLGPKPAAFVSA